MVEEEVYCVYEGENNQRYLEWSGLNRAMEWGERGREERGNKGSTWEPRDQETKSTKRTRDHVPQMAEVLWELEAGKGGLG